MQDYDYTANDWCKYGAFGVDADYNKTPEYIKAQEFWLHIKAELLERYKDKYAVLKFVESITVMRFYEEPVGLYNIELIVKSSYEGRQTLANSHDFVTLLYDSRPSETKYNITITTFDWVVYDLYEDFIKFDPSYTKDEKYFAMNLCKEFVKSMHWEVSEEDVSHIFTSLFEFYTTFLEKVGPKIYF